MNIKITKTIDSSIEVQLPMFRKEKTSQSTTNYFAVLPDHTVIDVYVSPPLCMVKHWVAQYCSADIEKAFNKWETIGEAEFMEAHAKAIASLSLLPELTTKNDIPESLFHKEVADKITKD